MYFLDPLNSLDHNWDCLRFYWNWAHPSWKDSLIISLFSWELQIQGQSKRELKVSHPNPAPLGHKSGMSLRENTYGTSTHFSCFLQNQSSCKTVINEILQQVFQRILWPFSTTEEDQAGIFKLWGSNLSELLLSFFVCLFFFFLFNK